MKIYIVCWSGGYELPSYQAFRTYDDAYRAAKDWEKDTDEGDMIEILVLDTASLDIEREYSYVPSLW